MNRCNTCLYPDAKPDLHFEDGECSACRNFKNRPAVDWEARHAELLKLLDRHNGRVIVPSSGGKDSCYIALTLKGLGADVTAVTARTCHLTDIGRKNIDNLARYVRTIEVVPNMNVRAKLNRIGLDLVGDISLPEHWAIFTQPFQVAADTGIKLLMFGENSQNQYGGPVGSEQAMQLTRRWRSEYGGFLGLRPSDVVGMEGITSRDMADYELPGEERLEKAGIEAHFLGQYIPWSSRHNAKVAKDHGMLTRLPSPANWWDFENVDCAMTGLHDYAMWLKYSYGRGVAQISVDIRQGRVTRDYALAWMHRYDGLFPEEYMGVPIAEVLDRIDMTREQLQDVLDRFTNWEISPWRSRTA